MISYFWLWRNDPSIKSSWDSKAESHCSNSLEYCPYYSLWYDIIFEDIKPTTLLRFKAQLPYTVAIELPKSFAPMKNEVQRASIEQIQRMEFC